MKNNLPLIFEGYTKLKPKNPNTNLLVRSEVFQTSKLKIDAYYKRISNYKNVQK